MKRVSSLPKISIITPSFNQGQFIEETITSVLTQQYPHVEYWVIDGGSTDNTVSILKKYQKHLRFVSEKDRGQTHAINKGIKKSTGEIIGYLNSDDVLAPGALKTVGALFRDHPEAAWLTGEYRIINAHGTTIQPYVTWYKRLLRLTANKQVLSVANYISQPSTFWRRSAMQRVGLFDERLRYCMDFQYWLRLFQESPPLICNQELSSFRIHGASKGGSAYEKQFAEEHAVLKATTSNPLILLLHKLHASAIVGAYKLLK